ncbi:MAG: penicillin-binding protein 2 [Candidatus Pacebacteria bacterium]|nr:penicillin-binding protein 2 [Candidatus Paceibacterota bacterium]
MQIVQGEIYQETAEGQYISTDHDIFNRGNIFFKTTNNTLISAATVTTGYRLIMNPKKLVDKEDAYEKLSTIVELNHQTFLDHASKNTTYRELSNKLSVDTKEKIDALAIPGISTLRYKWRLYPGGTLASHILGFVGYKGDSLTGRYGVEQFYNDTLSRSDDALYINFFAEIFARIDMVKKDNNKISGDIVLTIDPVVQAQIEKTIQSVQKTWNSSGVGAIVMDPHTGAILAMGNTPVFDPNNYETVSDISIFTNSLTENVYEMGSVIKPLVMAGAIDLGVIVPTTPYFDSGSIVVEKKEIYNFDKKGRGQVTMQDVLGESLNTGMVFVADKMGSENLRKYLYSFGFNTKTGIDLPNESRNLVENLEVKNRKLEYATAAFGQGVAITPITAVRAFATLGNGGYLVTPHVVSSVIKDNVTRSREDMIYERGAQVISQQTSETITSMLVKNVDEYYGEGKYKLVHYSVGAKTGTAQIPNKENGGYYVDKHLHTFFGYFPAYNPRYIVFFYNYNPKNVKYSSQTLLQPFMDTAKFLISYFDIPPDR